MSSRYDLGARFETQGIFWPSTDKTKQFPAHLKSGRKRIELIRVELEEIRRLFESETPNISVVHGITTMGPCTLIGLQVGRVKKVFNAASENVVATPHFRVSAIVFGLHIQDEAVQLFGAATFSYAGAGVWVSPTTQIERTAEAIVISHPIAQTPPVNFCVCASKTCIQVESVSRISFFPGGRHSGSRDELQVSVQPFEPVSLVWLSETARRFENFLSLCVGTSVGLRAVRLDIRRDGNHDEGWLVGRTRGKVEKPDEECWIRCNASQLSASIAAWLSMPETFRPFENLVYGTIRNTPLFVETEFLSLAQGLESLHRLTESGTLAPPSVFKRVLKALLLSIRSVCPSPALADRLCDAIRYANEPSFKNRIESLLNRITAQHARELLGDPQLFEETLRRTRNFLTHVGIRKQNGVLVGTKEIFLFNQKLHALLRLLMLQYLGFPEDLVFGPVKYQSRKWK
jgi:hypothetical protein